MSELGDDVVFVERVGSVYGVLDHGTCGLGGVNVGVNVGVGTACVEWVEVLGCGSGLGTECCGRETGCIG